MVTLAKSTFFDARTARPTLGSHLIGGFAVSEVFAC